MRFTFFLLVLALTVPAFAKKLTLPIMGRRYTIVTPDKKPNSNKPLLVILHGCKQNPNLILDGAELETEAIKKEFFIIAPEQSVLKNVDHCWNWFMDINQQRSVLNEMGQIIGAINTVATTMKIDRERIYLAGMSAGGAMAHNLAVCYPDVFSAVAIHSGLAYKVAENIYEAQTVLTASQLKSPNYLGESAYLCGREVNQKRLKKMVMIHGNQDKRVDPFHQKLISETNEVMMDYLDDNRRNNSLKIVRKVSEQNVGNGYSVIRTEKNYGKLFEVSYLVKGMGHAWGGGKALSNNFDPKAPSSTQLILNFFQLK